MGDFSPFQNDMRFSLRFIHFKYLVNECVLRVQDEDGLSRRNVGGWPRQFPNFTVLPWGRLDCASQNNFKLPTYSVGMT